MRELQRKKIFCPHTRKYVYVLYYMHNRYNCSAACTVYKGKYVLWDDKLWVLAACTVYIRYSEGKREGSDDTKTRECMRRIFFVAMDLPPKCTHSEEREE